MVAAMTDTTSPTARDVLVKGTLLDIAVAFDRPYFNVSAVIDEVIPAVDGVLLSLRAALDGGELMIPHHAITTAVHDTSDGYDVWTLRNGVLRVTATRQEP